MYSALHGKNGMHRGGLSKGSWLIHITHEENRENTHGANPFAGTRARGRTTSHGTTSHSASGCHSRWLSFLL
ncbi:hypothetical protein X975_21602, partial [Stegodyphus mimosarum]